MFGKPYQYSFEPYLKHKQKNMGLAEKRLAQEIKDSKLPEFESKIKDLAGYPIKVDIDWDTFTA
jgi:hypothetical protein